MPSDAIPKPAAPSPILDRFRLLLRERENEIRVSAGDDEGVVAVPPPSSEEIVRFYVDVLSELTFNSKPIITDLTIIAGEQREHGEGIADAICARVLEVPIDQKLPSLYLVDSIVKNIGREYVRHFASHLPEVFCEAYRQIPPNLYPSMRHLFGTWLSVFPSSVLRKIEDELQFSPRMNQPSSSLAGMRASESPRPSHGIHVNLSYLKTRGNLDNSSLNDNVQLSRGGSDLRTLGQKQPNLYDDYESDTGEGVTSNIGTQRLNPTAFKTRMSFPLSTDMLPSTGSGRPLSSSVDEFAMSKFQGRFFENISPSVPGYNYGNKVRGRDEETGDWQKRLRSDDRYHGFGKSNGLDHDRPRALIDAYGHDDGQRPLNEKPLKINSRLVNGALSNIDRQSWKNTEEEEFDWEDMSPTLADSKASDHTQSSTLPSGGLRAGRGVDPLGSISCHPSFQRSSWTTSNQIRRLDGSQKAVEDANLIQDSGHGSSKKSLITSNQINRSTEYHHSQGTWKLPGNHAAPGENFSCVGGESSSQSAFPVSGVPSFSDGKLSRADEFAAVSNITSRIVSSGFSSFEASTTPAVVPVSAGVWPCTGANNMIPLPPLFPQQQQFRSPVDFMNPSHRVPYRDHRQFNNDDGRAPVTVKPTPLLRHGFIPLHHPNRPPLPMQQQSSLSQELRPGSVSAITPLPPQIIRPPMSLGYTPLGQGVATSNNPSNMIPNVHPSFSIPNASSGPLLFQAPVSHLAPGSRPPSQILPLPQSSGPLAKQVPTIAVSGLINSLVAQGVLSMAKQTAAQESFGIEFNPDLLKVRHESSIIALYDDLPRQCTTCGLRFKTQEEHSKHMDWHVAKNRISKNRKYNPSRKWFVSSNMWLCGTEGLGTDSAPGFLPTETAVEMKVDEELAVPADEDQNTCALCGEPFEDFYSDETEEWMYRGAVYLSVPDGSVAGMDRSQLGRIVHAKCRSDSSAAPS